jgi:hypothetical protein
MRDENNQYRHGFVGIETLVDDMSIQTMQVITIKPANTESEYDHFVIVISEDEGLGNTVHEIRDLCRRIDDLEAMLDNKEKPLNEGIRPEYEWEAKRLHNRLRNILGGVI